MMMLTSCLVGESFGRRRRSSLPTFRDRVEAFYRRYVPTEKWKNIDLVSEMYEGKERELNEGLRQKYDADLNDVVVVIPKDDPSSSSSSSPTPLSDEKSPIHLDNSHEDADVDSDDNDESYDKDQDDDETDYDPEQVDVFGHPIINKPSRPSTTLPTSKETPRFRTQQQHFPSSSSSSSSSSPMKIIIIVTIAITLGGCIGVLSIIFRDRLKAIYVLLKDAVQQATSKAFQQEDDTEQQQRQYKTRKRKQYMSSSDIESENSDNEETTQLLDEETRIVNEEMSSELIKFLNSIGVRPKSVAKKLYEAGFERWDTFRYVTEKDLVQFGFRRGRVLLIKQRLKRLDSVTSKPIEMRPMTTPIMNDFSSSSGSNTTKRRRKQRHHKNNNNNNNKKRTSPVSTDSERQDENFPSHRKQKNNEKQTQQEEKKSSDVMMNSDDSEEKFDDDDDASSGSSSLEDEFDKLSKEWNKAKPSTILQHKDVDARKRRVDVDWSEDGQVYETTMQTGAVGQIQAKKQKENGLFEKLKRSRIEKKKNNNNNKKKKNT
jgi:hypothetical protein